MSDNFEGHAQHERGEYRTVGEHRAWCYECGEWCYPSLGGACKGCRIPALEERIRDLMSRLPEYQSLCSCGYGGYHEPELARCELNKTIEKELGNV